MAQPGENARSKISVLTQLLYHIKPLPPFHHVPNVDRGSQATQARTPSIKKLTPVARALFESYAGRDLPRTQTYPSDFWPATKADGPLPRPILLGMELIPRDKPLLLAAQRESWEYVLRKCFVRQVTPVSEGIKGLGFGAENLLKLVAEPESRYMGAAVDPKTYPRDLTMEQWARVVDVFHNWAFRPEVSSWEGTKLIISIWYWQRLSKP
jgi:hypothetical protein